MAEHNASEASKLRKDLEAAKLREAEVQSQLTESQQREAVVCNKNLALMDQRDAATGALEIARTGLREIAGHSTTFDVDEIPYIANQALSDTSDPSAALAERDRAIEKRTRKGVIALLVVVDKNCEMYPAIQYLEHEFGLESKTEGE